MSKARLTTKHAESYIQKATYRLTKDDEDDTWQVSATIREIGEVTVCECETIAEAFVDAGEAIECAAARAICVQLTDYMVAAVRSALRVSYYLGEEYVHRKQDLPATVRSATIAELKHVGLIEFNAENAGLETCEYGEAGPGWRLPSSGWSLTAWGRLVLDEVVKTGRHERAKVKDALARIRMSPAWMRDNAHGRHRESTR